MSKIKKAIPVFVLVASAILLVINLVVYNSKDAGFWARIISNILIIVSMALVLKTSKTQNKNS